MSRSYVITGAAEDGYVVAAVGEPQKPLFAGDLDEALAFVRRKQKANEPPPPPQARPLRRPGWGASQT